MYLHRPALRPAELHHLLQHRDLDYCFRQVDVFARHEIELTLLKVQVPLTRSIQLLKYVFYEEPRLVALMIELALPDARLRLCRIAVRSAENHPSPA